MTDPTRDPVLLEAERRRREKASALGSTGAAPRGHRIRGPGATPGAGTKLDVALEAFTAEARPTGATKRPKERERCSERREAAPPSDSFAAEDACAADLEAAEREPHYRDALLPAGAYVEASFVSVTERNIVGGAPKWLAIFRIHTVLPPHEHLLAGGLILRSWNPPSGRWLSPRHALAADWEAVVGCPLRTLPRRYTASALLGAAFRGVTVKAVTRVVDSYHDPKTRTTKPQPPYSVIDRLLGRTAGTPRLLQRKTSS